MAGITVEREHITLIRSYDHPGRHSGECMVGVGDVFKQRRVVSALHQKYFPNPDHRQVGRIIQAELKSVEEAEGIFKTAREREKLIQRTLDMEAKEMLATLKSADPDRIPPPDGNAPFLILACNLDISPEINADVIKAALQGSR